MKYELLCSYSDLEILYGPENLKPSSVEVECPQDRLQTCYSYLLLTCSTGEPHQIQLAVDAKQHVLTRSGLAEIMAPIAPLIVSVQY